MFEVTERSKFPVRIYGKDYELQKPTFGQVSAMQAKVRSGEGGTDLEIFSEFLAGVGLPQDVTRELEVEHVSALVERLCGAKKN